MEDQTPQETKRVYLKIDLLGNELRNMLDEMVADIQKTREMNTSVLIRELIRAEYGRRCLGEKTSDMPKQILSVPIGPSADAGNDG